MSEEDLLKQTETASAEGTKTKREIKDSLFTRVFGIPEYAFQLYKVFHPEDTTSTEKELRIITLENVLVDDEYNDLGLLLNNHLMLFVEAQSTWNSNMAIRILFYLNETYRRYLTDNSIDILHDTDVVIPVPEAYVIFTGERGDKPDIMSLSDHFPKDGLNFSAGTNSLDLKVKMIYNSSKGDIVYQYIAFCKVYDAQKMKYPGDRKKALLETIRICKDKNVLADFLRKHEAEVRKIMYENINDFLMKIHIDCEKKRSAHDSKLETARKMLDKGLSLEMISDCTALPLSEITALQSEAATV